MGFLDFIFGKSSGTAASGGYDSVIAWIKTNYGGQFHDGMTVSEVKSALIGIRPANANPGFKSALETYIAAEKYGNLVKVKE